MTILIKNHRLISILLCVSAVQLFYPFSNAFAQNSQPKILSGPAFVLSEEARAAGIDGTLTISLTVDKNGAAKNIRVVAGPAWPCGSSPKDAIDRVRDAVKKHVAAARFEPELKEGKPDDADIAATFAIGEAYRDAIKEKDARAAMASGAQPPKLLEGGILTGKALSLPKPSYPSMARASRVSGTVPVKVLIDEEGKVLLAGAVGGHPLLQSSARTSACGAKFQPTELKGIPVKVSGVITYNFVP